MGLSRGWVEIVKKKRKREREKKRGNEEEKERIYLLFGGIGSYGKIRKTIIFFFPKRK